MDWKKKIKENWEFFMLFIILSVAILFFTNSDNLVTTFYPEVDDYPFDYIRATEKRVFINGTIIFVEYIDWEHCELFYEDEWGNIGNDYFSKDSFGKLKKFEGQKVTIMCYTQGWDGYHRLYACNDWDMGYVKPCRSE